MGYAANRMKEAGYVPSEHTVSFQTREGEVIQQPIAWEDKQGNLVTATLGLDGFYEFDPFEKNVDLEERQQPIHQVVRLARPTEKGKMYTFPSGMGVRPMCTPLLRSAYENVKKQKCLIITEGIWKSLIASILGDVGLYGIPGINTWGEKDQREAFPDIGKLIERLKVSYVIFLVDADLFDVEWGEHKDLRKRPWAFYKAVTSFKKYLQEYQKEKDIELQLAWIKPQYEAKGIDDLLIKFPTKVKSIIKDLQKVTGNCTFFEKRDISHMSLNRIQELFHIQNVQQFYKEYQDQINNRAFVYAGNLYVYDEDISKLRITKSEYAKNICLIGDKWILRGDIENEGYIEEVTQAVGIKSLQHHWNMSHEKVLEHLKGSDKFFSIINRPDHRNYNRKVVVTNPATGKSTNWYNLYNPISHVPSQGKCELSINFVKHIFGEHVVDTIQEENFDTSKGKIVKTERIIYGYDIGLDYIKLLWEKPTRKLPILCLVSEERETGKTTFCDWMRSIFQQNCKEIKASDLTEKFSGYRITSLINFIDETLIEKSDLVEALKSQSTAKMSQFNEKFMPTCEVHNFVKYILNSNKVKRFIKIDPEEKRFLVIEVPTLEGKLITNFFQRLVKEIPHFLDYLINRPYATKDTTRQWFDNKYIETEATKKIKENSGWGSSKNIKEHVRERFFLIEKPVYLTTSKLMANEIGLKNQEIRDSLEIDMKLEKRSSYKFTYWAVDHNEQADPDPKPEVMKREPFAFFCCDYISKDDYLDYCDNDDLIELEQELRKSNRPSFFKDFTLEDVHKIRYIKNNCKDIGDDVIEARFKILQEKSTKPFFDFIQDMIKRAESLVDIPF